MFSKCVWALDSFLIVITKFLSEFIYYTSTGSKTLYWIGILDELNMTLDQFKAWAKTQTIQFLYPLATPTEISVEPVNVETREGINNIFANTGDTSVTYGAKITS